MYLHTFMVNGRSVSLVAKALAFRQCVIGLIRWVGCVVVTVTKLVMVTCDMSLVSGTYVGSCSSTDHTFPPKIEHTVSEVVQNCMYYIVCWSLFQYKCIQAHQNTLGKKQREKDAEGVHCCYRFIQYKPTSLERSFKYDLLTEHDLGVTIDLINPETYKINPSGKPDTLDSFKYPHNLL